MFSFFKNNKPPYAVERIEAGELLENAQAVDIHYFISCWLNKRPRKAMVGCWFVLREDEAFVYFGKPKFKRLFSDKRTVDVFYKTSKKELEKRFPIYKKPYGNFIKQKIYKIITDVQKGEGNSSDIRFYRPLSGKLLPNNSIEIKAICIFNSEKEKEKTAYRIQLNSVTLDLIELKKTN